MLRITLLFLFFSLGFIKLTADTVQPQGRGCGFPLQGPDNTKHQMDAINGHY